MLPAAIAYAAQAGMGWPAVMQPTRSCILACVSFQKAYRIPNGLDCFRSIIGNFNAKLFLECHDQFNGIETVGAEIVDEAGVFRDLVLFDAEMFDDDFFTRSEMSLMLSSRFSQ